MRSDLRLDLKDSGVLWSNDELNRSIEKAFSDLSRFLPDEKVFEDSLQFTVSDESVTFPLDAVAGQIVATESLYADETAAAAGDTCTIDGQPDVPRPLRYLITDANNSITGMTIIVDGIDKDDQAIQEIQSYTKGDSKLWMGKKYFKAVYQVEFDQIYGAATGDQFELGIGAYTDVWVSLANSPIKHNSDTGVGDDDVAIVKNTDYYIDYANGRVKAISGGLIAAGEVCEFTYKKSQIGIDISDLPDLIRVQRVEYPVGQIPQNFIQGDTFGKYYVVTGMGESEEQRQMAEDEQYRIYYDARHQMPGEYSPSSAPEFLEDTVMLAASAYALLMKALQYDQQSVIDFASARTELGKIAHTDFATALTSAAAQIALAGTALGKVSSETHLTDASVALNSAATALAKVSTYLENNSSEDSKYWLTKITTDILGLRTAILTALDNLSTFASGVATDLTSADGARANYMGAKANYVDGGSAPDIKKYLDDGDALLNTVPVGGEGQEVPRAYAEYARAVKETLVGSHELDRQLFQQSATARTNAAMAFASEVAQRMSNLRSYIEEADAWGRIASGFVAEANQRIAEASQRVGIVDRYIGEAVQRNISGAAYIDEANSHVADMDRYIATADRYMDSATQNLGLADRFRAEAYERRNEVYSIWRDRKQYIGDFTAGSVRQMPNYK